MFINICQLALSRFRRRKQTRKIDLRHKCTSRDSNSGAAASRVAVYRWVTRVRARPQSHRGAFSKLVGFIHIKPFFLPNDMAHPVSVLIVWHIHYITRTRIIWSDTICIVFVASGLWNGENRNYRRRIEVLLYVGKWNANVPRTKRNTTKSSRATKWKRKPKPKRTL